MFNKSKIKRFILNYKYCILSYFLLFVFSLIFRFSIFEDKYLSNITYAAINSLLIILAVVIISPTKLRILIVILMSLLISVDVALFYVYEGPMNYTVLASILETNLAEAHGMGKLVLPAGIVSFLIFLFLMHKSSLEIKIWKRSFRTTVLLIVSFVAGVFILPILFTFTTSVNNISEAVRYNQQLSGIAYYSSIMRLKYPFVIGDIFITAAYFDDLHKLQMNSKRVKVLPQGVGLQQSSNSVDKIILIIGESSNKGNYSLYGYEKKTSPFLDSLSVNSPETFSFFDNVISPAAATRDALRICLSFSTARNFRPFTEEYNLVNMAKNAGYQTIWISNQNNLSWYENLVNMVSSSSDTTIFKMSRTNLFPDDLNLPPVVSQMLQPDKKQFIVVHLEGSHLPYDKRYDSVDARCLENKDETVEYDRSIHHTDRVLRYIYKSVQNSHENVVMYYFSDHGEVINQGHAFVNRWKVQYKVPLVIIQNRSFIDVNGIVNKYYDKETARLSTANSIFVLSELMGYQVADSLVLNAQTEGRYVYQSDASYCSYTDIKD